MRNRTQAQLSNRPTQNQPLPQKLSRTEFWKHQIRMNIIMEVNPLLFRMTKKKILLFRKQHLQVSQPNQK